MQNEIKLTEFFEKDFVDYSSYDNLRKIASAIDGLKNSSRKVIYTVLDKNIFELTKVSQLSAKAAEHADYLHGSLDGVVVTLGQDFQGTNQLPLLQKKGNFGTKAIPEPSASRYIFACGSKPLKELFNRLDDTLLVQQTFEGAKIEPQFFVPDMPILLVNGSKGVSSGFAQNILGRDFQELHRIVSKFFKTLNYEVLREVNGLSPFIGNFNGTVERDVEAEGFRWIFTTNFKIHKNEAHIEDLPYDMDLRSFLNILDKLEDEKKIKSFEDLSNGDKFKFVVKFDKKVILSDSFIIKLLKLQTSVTENFTCLDRHNKILLAVSPYDILREYAEVKLDFLRKRKDLMMSNLANETGKISSISKFIGAVLDGEINMKEMDSTKLNKLFRDWKMFRSDGDSHEGFGYLHRIPMGKMAVNEVKKLEEDFAKTYERFKEVGAMEIFEIWKINN